MNARVNWQDCQDLVAALQLRNFNPLDAVATLLGAAAFTMGLQSEYEPNRTELLKSFTDFEALLAKGVQLGREAQQDNNPRWRKPS